MSATTIERDTPAPALSPGTRRLLHGAIVPTLLRLAWPNMLVMLAQAATGLIETYWIGRLGPAALAAAIVVYGIGRASAIRAGVWFRPLRADAPSSATVSS